MKTSRFNFFLPFNMDKEQVIAYNSLTNALALMNVNDYNETIKLLEGGIPVEHHKSLEDLKKGGFIVEDNLNELDLIKYNSLSAKFSTSHLGLTIAPTIDCNFDCIYCYEKDSRHNSKMTDEMQNKVIELVNSHKSHIEDMGITWYGGEPLLALDVIENLSNKFIEICSENNIRYSAGIVTNGYKLDREAAMKLKMLNVRNVQVTLDGPPSIHNKRRPLVGGQATFDKILKNLEDCVDILDNIAVRINVDKENINELDEIMSIMHNYNLLGKVSIYLGYVETPNDCYSKQTCLDFGDYSKISMDFNKSQIKNNAKINLLSFYPSIKRNNCCADSKNGLVIAPDGEIYKCWNDIGIKRYSIGNIAKENTDSNIDGINRLNDFIMYDVTKDEECKDCAYLPICMGGCPRRRLEKEESRCTQFKFIFDSYLNELAETLYVKDGQECVCK